MSQQRIGAYGAQMLRRLCDLLRQDGDVREEGTQVTGEVRRPATIEWPTMLVAVGCWSSWIGALVMHDRLWWPVIVVWLALSGGWYMSLQHEVIHGHPTPWKVVNGAIASAPLSLWLPMPVYRTTHLEHHEVELTRAGVDPESFYVTPETWLNASPLKRAYLRCNRTLLGRLVIGPPIAIPTLVISEIRRSRREGTFARVWLSHALGVVVVGWVVFGLADVPVWLYVVGYCWLGNSVSYLRSFVEHLAVPAPATRSAVVRSGWFFGLLFLNNNLHHTHHAVPGAAWYRLPQLTRELGSETLASEGAGYYRGYIEVARRFGVRPFSTPVSPLEQTVNQS